MMSGKSILCALNVYPLSRGVCVSFVRSLMLCYDDNAMMSVWIGNLQDKTKSEIKDDLRIVILLKKHYQFKV